MKEKEKRPVHRKKKPQKTKPQSSPALSAEEKVLLDALLTDIENLDLSSLRGRIPSLPLALAFVENLPLDSARTPEFLGVLSGAFQQKEVQKAVRKVLFKLKQKGVSLPGLTLESAPTFLTSKVAQDKPRAYVGPVDGVGSRPVLIVIPQMTQGIDLGMGLINDEQGIVEMAFRRHSRKRAKEVETMFLEKVPFMVETSLAHATTLLERAYGLKARTGEPSGDYSRMRPWLLEHASLLEKPVVYDHLPLESISREPLTGSQIQRLLSHELLAGWFVEPDKLKTVVDEMISAEQSPIFISEIQKVERINQIKEASIVRLYSEAQREVVKQRLEEMAYLFLKLGEEPLARIALGCALSFEEKDSLLKVNLFLRALLEKSLALYVRGTGAPGMPKQPDQAASRIIVR